MPLPAAAAAMLKQMQENAAKAMVAAKAKNDAAVKDDALAREKGSTPAHIEARKRVAALFCDIHFPADKPAAREVRLAPIDYTQPVSPANGRTVAANSSKPAGFFGMGRKPAYLVSEAYPPKTPEEPIYALQYIPIKR
jgi:hypothetical protein